MASNTNVFRGPQFPLAGVENQDHANNMMYGRGRTQQQPMYQHHQRIMDSGMPLYSGVGGGVNNNMGMSGNMMMDGRRDESNGSSDGPSCRTVYHAGKKGNKDMEVTLKTPVSLLNEVCAKARVEPVFELKEDGLAHAKVFVCIVKVEKQGCVWEGTGQSNNKKDAKQEAAKNLLLSMDSNVEKMLSPMKAAPAPGSGTESSESMIETDPDPEGNPVGELNDITLKLKRMPPEYEEIGEEGKPHERVYTVACKLGSVGSQIVEHGTGRSKKHAKKAAAFKAKLKLIEALKQGEIDAAAITATAEAENQNGSDKTDDIVTLLSNASISTTKKKSKSKKTSSSLPNGNEQWKLSEWLNEFKERSGEKLISLKEPNSSTTDPVKLLREIADEQKFKVEYFDVEKPEMDELFSCIVSIGMQPTAIFMGKGGSKTQAKKSAAKSAVEFLITAIGR